MEGSRRWFFRSASGLLWLGPSALGCGRSPASGGPGTRDAGAVPPATTPAAGGWSAPQASPAAPPAASPVAPAAAQVCRATEANILGPYWRDGAPFRDNLLDAGISGDPLVIEGRVLAADCSAPVAGAVLDFWQADGKGRYDNDGSTKVRPGAMWLRGKVRSDSDGRFRVRTVVPGHYLNGSRYRPAHVHVRIEAAGFAGLTTQLYFPGDPYNEGDPFLRPSLLMRVGQPSGGNRMAGFDFVLARG